MGMKLEHGLDLAGHGSGGSRENEVEFGRGR